MRNLYALLRHAGPAASRQVAGGIALTTLAAFADVVSLFLLHQSMLSLTSSVTAGSAPKHYVLMVFVIAALIGSMLRLVAQTRTIGAQYEVHRMLSLKTFNILQHQDYATYLQNGASEGFTAFERLQLVAFHALASAMSAVVSVIGIVAILGIIFYLYPVVGGVLLFGLICVGVEFRWRKAAASTDNISELAQRRSSLLYQARTAFRDIVLTNGQDKICSDFADMESRYRREQAASVIAAQSSKSIIEIAGLLAVLALLLSLGTIEGLEIMPLLGVLALGAFRLIPQIASLRASDRLMRIYSDVTRDMRLLLDRELQDAYSAATNPHIAFANMIELHGISLAHHDRLPTLRNVDLSITKAERVGISGPSGSGKSTLLDIICGLIAPDSGTVQIDGIGLNQTNSAAWRDRIGVVSQSPVLFGRTLRDVITFPQRPDEVDKGRFEESIKQAGITQMVEGFARGLDTPIGEVSALLSGGQRQRLALAHALYRAQDMLILDEATGQLDHESEDVIISTIKALPRDLAIVIVSHRAALFECCDIVYTLDQGRLNRQSDCENVAGVSAIN